VRLADQLDPIVAELPPGWQEAQLKLDVHDPTRRRRAVSLLGPLQPAVAGAGILIWVDRARGLTAVRRALEGIDRERIEGRLQLARTREAEPAAAPAARAAPTGLAAQWQAALARLPEDWSDAWVEVELTSSDFVEPGALLLAPCNPTRDGDRFAFRFRSARQQGYGAAPEMVRRCLERLDAAGVRGGVGILNSFSETRLVQTQGPVLYVGGRTV
jgi:hypothetical protein